MPPVAMPQVSFGLDLYMLCKHCMIKKGESTQDSPANGVRRRHDDDEDVGEDEGKWRRQLRV